MSGRRRAVFPKGVEMDSAIIKRTVTLNGRKSSITLEDEFWDGLKEIAGKRGVGVSQLVSEISTGRARANLSSTLRVFVLRHYKTRPA